MSSNLRLWTNELCSRCTRYRQTMRFPSLRLIGSSHYSKSRSKDELRKKEKITGWKDTGNRSKLGHISGNGLNQPRFAFGRLMSCCCNTSSCCKEKEEEKCDNGSHLRHLIFFWIWSSINVYKLEFSNPNVLSLCWLFPCLPSTPWRFNYSPSRSIR